MAAGRADAQSRPGEPPLEHASGTRKAMRRLLPLMFGIYFLSFVDRTNVALAKSALETQLGITAGVYGLGAGIFFLGYALLEVPSNLVAYRIGPRRWIARIAISWGLVSAAMLLVQGAWSFAALRLVLGITEAGLFPALMYVTTLWFTQKDRSVAVGWIYTAPALGLVLGNPLGGLFLHLDGLAGLHGWQWLFLIEGAATVVFGVVLLFVFPDGPQEAAWLSRPEAEAVARYALSATGRTDHAPSRDWLPALRDPGTWLMGLVYFFNQVGFVGLYFFAPAMVQQMHVSNPVLVGLLSSTVGIGFLAGVLVLPRLHRHASSDYRFLGLVTAGLVAASALFMAVTTPGPQLVLFAVTAFFAGGILPIYWAVAMKRLRGIEAAAGLALINTVGLLGGFVGPYLFGLAESRTGSSASGYVIILLTSLVGLVLIPFLARASRPREPGPSPSFVPGPSGLEP